MFGSRLVRLLPSRLSMIRYSSQASSGNNPHKLKVALLGAHGSVGQSLALQLKLCPIIDELALYDSVPTKGYAKDLSYIDTKCWVGSYNGKEQLSMALDGSTIVVIVAATPQGDQLPYKAMFDRNAPLVRDLVLAVTSFAPKSMVVVGTNPVNSIVPMATELFEKKGLCAIPVFGVTTLDVVRANKFVGELLDLPPETVTVPVVGGHTEKTIVPLLSQARPCANFTKEELQSITDAVRQADGKMLKIKLCEGPTLSQSFAVARFVLSLAKAIKGTPNIVECAYVKGLAHPQVRYLAVPLALGPGGIQKNLGLPDMTDFETCLLDNAVCQLMEDIKLGVSFVKGKRGEMKAPERPPRTPKCPKDNCLLKTATN